MNKTWTKCADQLPEEPGKYLAIVRGYSGDSYIEIIIFSKNLHLLNKFDFPNQKRPGWCKLDNEAGYYELTNVTHWMELPDMPEK